MITGHNNERRAANFGGAGGGGEEGGEPQSTTMHAVASLSQRGTACQVTVQPGLCLSANRGLGDGPIAPRFELRPSSAAHKMEALPR